MEPNTTHDFKSVKNAVLANIRAGQTKTRPRLYFAVRIALVIFVAFLSLLVSALLFSFLFFRVMVEGEAPLVYFGSEGFFLFLRFIPWPLIITDIILLFVLHRLVRTFRFGYRSPASFMLVGLLVAALGFGFLLFRATGINDSLADHAGRGEFPEPVGSWFRPHHHAPPPPGGLVRGTVIASSPDSFTLENTEFGTTTIFTIVRLPDAPPFPTLIAGDQVFVAGRPEGTSTIRAFGVRRFDDSPSQGGSAR
jgi:hypothetical protein